MDGDVSVGWGLGVGGGGAERREKVGGESNTE